MSTKRILLDQRKGLSFVPKRPAKTVTKIRQKILTNPTEADLERLRSAKWKVAFEGISIAAMPNGGMKQCHLVRLEKPLRVIAPIFS